MGIEKQPRATEDLYKGMNINVMQRSKMRAEGEIDRSIDGYQSILFASGLL